MGKLSWRSIVIVTIAGAGLACGESPEPSGERRVEAGMPDDATFLDSSFEPVDAAMPPRVDAAVDMDLRDAAERPVEVHSVETELGSESTTAGLANRITCRALDAAGDAIEDIDTNFEMRPAVGWSRVDDEPDELIGTAAGVYSVTCTIRALGLRDATPARWEVTPGAVTRARTLVGETSVSAGDSFDVACEAADAYGNMVDAEDVPLMVQPAGAAVSVEGHEVTITAAGRYSVTCDLAGPDVQAATVTVVPTLPARIVATVDPDLPIHSSGTVVSYPAIVLDSFDNPVPDVALAWNSAPALQPFGEGRFMTAEDGRFNLRVEVVDDTLDDVALFAETEILVDSGGPTIACSQPVEGAMIRLGQGVTMTGQVADLAGLDRFEIDGQEVVLDEMGQFSVEVESGWGLNVRQLTARDSLGHENSTFCSYFAAPDYFAEAEMRSDAVQMFLRQPAIDDGGPDRPIESMGDILRGILNSQGLVDTVDARLRAQNPVMPEECVTREFGFCIITAGAIYRGMVVRGPNDARISLEDGGLRLSTTLNNFEVDVSVTGTAPTRGTITVESLSIEAFFSLSLVGGQPQVTLIGEPLVMMGGLSGEFEGAIIGTAYDLVFNAFEDTLRRTLSDAVADFMTNQVDAMLSGILSGIDLEDLGQVIEVPSVGGDAPVNIAFQPEWSSLEATEDFLRLGLGMQVTAPAGQGAPSEGVPVLPGDRAVVAPAQEMGAVIRLDFLNQVLHQLWRAGLFSIDDAGELAGQDGIQISLRLLTPPAAEGLPMGDRIRLHFGPAVAEMAYPGLIDEPVQIRLAATMTAGVAVVNGNEFVFGPEGSPFAIETLRMVIEGATMTAQARAAFEEELRGIIEGIAGQLLSDALPQVPVPEFMLPEALEEFGVEPNTSLGLRDPAIDVTRDRFILGGDFSQ